MKKLSPPKSRRRKTPASAPKPIEAAAPASVLVLRTCDKDLRSYNGFQWPSGGPVEALDWMPTKSWGHGLHGLLWGQGGAHYFNWNPDARWLVVEVAVADLIDLHDKVKFRRGTVVHCGDRITATRYLFARLPAAVSALVVGLSAEVGYGSTLTGGYGSTLTGGYGSTLTGGYGSTLTGGYRSTLTGGYGSTLTGGYGSTLTGGYGSTLTGGDGSTLTGGDRSTLTGGDGSTLTGGYRSTLTGGYRSTLTGGYRSTLTGGDGSTLVVRYWDAAKSCFRILAAEINADALKAGVKYRVENGRFIAA